MSQEHLVDWARERGLELTAENRPVVASYLRRTRLLRACGALAGILLPTLVELVWHGRLVILGASSDGSVAPYAGPMEAYIGYLVGALCAEVTLARPRDRTRHSASLVPRRLEDYLPRRLMLAQRALGVAVVLGIVITGLVPYPSPASVPDWTAQLTGVVVFGAFAVALEALERWIVRRPQPFTSPSLVAADDAIRAQSVHALSGSGLALLLAALSGLFAVVTASDVEILRWTMWLPALAAFVLSVRACLDIGQQPWRVRRRADRPAGAAPA
jgi:protein-S-isoprenylcysteine O-methyltransferase Ste14